MPSWRLRHAPATGPPAGSAGRARRPRRAVPARRPPRPPPASSPRRRPPGGANSARSGAVSRAWLQSTAARSVWWRSSAVRCRRSGAGSGRPGGPGAAPTGSTRTRAAASSSASGRPSSRAQIRATAARVLRPSARTPGCTATARSTNRRTASYRPSSSAAGLLSPVPIAGVVARRGGAGFGEAGGRGAGPGTPARRRRAAPLGWSPPHGGAGCAASRVVTSGEAPSTCSKLSSSSSRCRSRRASARLSAERRGPLLAHAERPGDRREHERRRSGRGQGHEVRPAASVAGTSVATSSARRVLPTPGGPVGGASAAESARPPAPGGPPRAGPPPRPPVRRSW